MKTLKKYCCQLSTVLLLLTMTSPLSADLITIHTTPSLDGNAWDNGNDGFYETLGLTSGSAYFNGTYDVTRVLLEFDLSDIPLYSTIHSAMLTITASAGGGSASTSVAVHSYIGNGILESADANPLGDLVGTAGGIVPAGVSKSFAIDTTFIASALNTTGYAGFQLRDIGGYIVSLEVRTSDFYPESQIPRLSIEYDPPVLVPEPSTIALFLTGAVGLVGYGWRRKKQLAA
ncbi:MAG: PEP-CTERM sorting domain-containing protein [Planctomycetota bacterium]|nr:PEP-CTERM sorting domain-containing protein [Planctomycetota bacterium]